MLGKYGPISMCIYFRHLVSNNIRTIIATKDMSNVGPSRLRRRVRREAARAYAAEEAAATVRGVSEKKNDDNKEDPIVEIHDNVSPPEAEQASRNQSENQHKTVQAVAKPNLNDENAEAVDKPHKSNMASMDLPRISSNVGVIA